MPKYVNERDILGAGKLSPAELRNISQRSMRGPRTARSQDPVDAELRQRRTHLLRLHRTRLAGRSRALEAGRLLGQPHLTGADGHRPDDLRGLRERTMTIPVWVLLFFAGWPEDNGL